MFSFFKKKQKGKELVVPPADKGNFQFQLELKPYLIDNLLTIQLPIEFIPYESDKFRAKTENGKKSISIASYQKEWKGENINKKFFEELKLNLFDRFVNEGGYEAYDDLKVTDEFIRKSFKVEEETQYYFTSARLINNNLIITEYIIREIGLYNRYMMPTLEIINRSVTF
ncbi:hypothetical protein LZQ00_04105 [Sphingobacterium sp. SRCM116780]|uniref:hypothetical protein n=1 Tax=Sphingobacterium sp. SRCM116780 TaxID=2907623 RepID=UPI001F37C932|nr:hypothetical protein [Sphingobacterium sp. SRCM116780]UIR57003.1 hypothetical protein LZQ00_04105 [Sphingobacterium sp. SRCM116780]